MGYHSEPAFPPQDFLVHNGLLIPCCIMVNYDAHIGVGVTETSEYLVAYAKCTVPQQRTFKCFSELDSQIVRQLEGKSVSMTLVPNLLAKVHRIASRVRNTWTVEYGLKFRDQGPNDGMTPSGLLQLTGMAGETVDVLPTGMQHPDTGLSILTRYTPPAGTMRSAGGGAFITFPAGYQYPKTVPGMHVPYIPPSGLLQLAVVLGELVNLLPTGIQHFNAVLGMPAPSMPPGETVRGAAGDAASAFPAGMQRPNMIPGVPVTYAPPNSDFAFRVPPHAGLRNFERPADFAGSSIAPKSRTLGP